MAAESRPAGNELGWIVRAIRKHLVSIILLVCVTVAAATAYVVLREDQYAAYAQILIEPDGDSFSDLEDEQDRRVPIVEPAEMETALKLVTSSQTLKKVIDQLDLQFDKGATTAIAGLPAQLSEMLQGLFKAEALENETAEEPGDAAIIRLFRDKLMIERDPLASIISIGYQSTDPEEAAEVANTLAEVYLSERLSTKRAIYSRTAEHLDERVQEMAAWLRSAEAEIERHRAEADLYELGGTAPVEQQYASLTDQLSAANVTLTEAESRLFQADRVLGDEGDFTLSALDSIREVQTSQVISNLRGQETEIRRRMADLRSEYGQNHPLLQNARAELNGVRSSIDAEIARIVEQLQLEVDVAANRVSTIEEKLREAQGSLEASQESRIRLRELERDAAGPRRLYEVLLDRSQRAREQEKLVSDTARIISPAIVPDRPSQVSGKLLMGIFAFAAGTAGAGLAIAWELRRPGYLDANGVINDLNYPVLGLVPRIRRAARDGSKDQKRSLEAFAFIEAVRGVVQQISPHSPGDGQQGGKVFALTSCFPDEGKTTLGLSLARQASFGGLKILLIECDLRKPGLTEQLKTVEADAGLLHILRGRSSIDQAVVTEPSSQVDMILGFGPAKDAFRLIRSQAMSDVIEQARQHYDIVILDCGPALAVSDTRSLIELADEVVFVVRWQTTDRSVVRDVVRDLQQQDVEIAGIVLTQIDLAEHIKYGQKDHLHYQDRYQGYALDI